MPSAVEPTLLMNITDMIDLSIGAPECGNVDFNMLHTVLHCIVQQINIRDKPVELRGDIAAISVGDMRSMKTVSIDEYYIETGNQESMDKDDTLLVVERLWKLDAEETKRSPLIKQSDETPQNKTTQKIYLNKRDEISKSQKVYSEAGQEYTEEVSSKQKNAKEKNVPQKNKEKTIVSQNKILDTPQNVETLETLPEETTEKRPNEETSKRRPKEEAPGKRQTDSLTAQKHEPTDITNKEKTVEEKALEMDTSSEVLSTLLKVPTERDNTETEEKYSVYKEKKPIISENMIRNGTKRPILTENSNEKLSLVTKSKFEELEAIVKELQETVHGCIPENEEIIREVRSQGNLKSITDLWTSLNISSRLKATEQATQKLGSIMQDVIGESGREMDELKAAVTDALFGVNLHEDDTEYKNNEIEVAESEAKQSIKKSLQDMKKAGTLGDISNLAGSPKLLPRILSSIPSSVATELQSLQKAIFDLRKEFDLMANDFYADGSDESADELNDQPSKDVKKGDNTAPKTDVASTPTTERRPSRPKRYRTSSNLNENNSGLTSDMNVAVHRILVKVNELDHRIKKCSDDMNKDNGQINDKIVNMQDQMEAFTRDLAEVSRSMMTTYPNNISKSLEGMADISHTINDIEKKLQQVNKTAQHLKAEKVTRQMQIDTLIEQIELLKHIKMDREDIVAAMGEKADISYCARKVNFTDFEQACEDLSQGLDFALEKLKLQESIWHKALDDIQQEIDAKLDKQELMPVKDFFNDKLLSLQVNLKKMAELRREAEAAGTRKRILRDVNCISCDAKVVMPMDPPEPPQTRPAPCSLSMKPYLTYELDTIRKTQKCITPQRNMRDWEQIEKQTRQPQRVRSDTDKHICNRYCGGNHTVTTPAQRVARTGHFVAQWGPDVVPLSAKLAAGDDGRTYKVNATESTLVGTGEVKGEKSRKKESGDRATTQTPYAECCCLGSSSVQSIDSEKSWSRQSLSKAHGAK